MVKSGITEKQLVDMFNSAPRRLEEQINKGHFKLAEERRLVAETDRLRRSRRTLKDWQVPSTPAWEKIFTSFISL